MPSCLFESLLLSYSNRAPPINISPRTRFTISETISFWYRLFYLWNTHYRSSDKQTEDLPLFFSYSDTFEQIGSFDSAGTGPVNRRLSLRNNLRRSTFRAFREILNRRFVDLVSVVLAFSRLSIVLSFSRHARRGRV